MITDVSLALANSVMHWRSGELDAIGRVKIKRLGIGILISTPMRVDKEILEDVHCFQPGRPADGNQRQQDENVKTGRWRHYLEKSVECCSKVYGQKLSLFNR